VLRDRADIPLPQTGADSLAAALAALVTARDPAIECAEIDVAVALGLPFLMCADCEQCDVARWASLASDVGLIEAAALFGVRARPLHPRATAAGLVTSPEYNQHFRDSYVPLVRRALAHDQPVLAWQGWPSPAERAWGIITHAEPATGGLRGVTAEAPGTVPLIGAPLQCYVIEQIDPIAPAAADVLACGAAAVARLHEECAATGPRIAGALAWHFWRDTLGRDIDAEELTSHLALARDLQRRREAGIDWLEQRGGNLKGVTGELQTLRSHLASVAAVLGNLVTALSQDSRHRMVQADARQPVARTAHHALDEAVETDQRCLAALQRVVAAMGPG
jgi:hypothetical protein